MKMIFSLHIDVKKEEKIVLIDKILGIPHNTPFGWQLELEEKEGYMDYINFFLDILEEKYEALEQIGITRDKISIWYYYEYDEQCNMEYSSQELKRMGENGIQFCISCYDSGKLYNNGEPFDPDSVCKKILN